MTKLQITKREVKIFFLGMLFGFLVVLVYEWDSAMDGIKGGYESAIIENE